MLEQYLEEPPLAQWVKTHPLRANLLLAVFYWALAMLGFWLSGFHHGQTPIWPATGLAFMAVLMGGTRLFPGILLGALVANFVAGLGFFPSVIAVPGSLIEAAVAYFMLHILKGRKDLLKSTTLPTWLVFAGLIAPIFSSTIHAYSMVYFGGPNAHLGFLDLWLNGWASRATGAMVIPPLVLSFKSFQFTIPKSSKLLFIVLLSASVTAFTVLLNLEALFLFLAIPVLLLANYWLRTPGCSIAAFTLVALHSFSTIASNHWGGMAAGWHSDPLFFDMILPVLGVTSIGIATFQLKWNLFLPATIILVGWSFSTWLFFSMHRASKQMESMRFLELVADTEHVVQDRLNSYIDALRSGASHYLSNGGVSRLGWSTYVATLDIKNRYRGINGMGFIMPFSPEELEFYVEHTRQKEYPQFTVKSVPLAIPPPPDETGRNHLVITHIEPLSLNRPALGLDVATERARQAAAIQSRDTGEPIITDRIQLVQDGQERPGFLLYYPIYQPGMATATVQQKRAAFIGWIYAPFVTQQFLAGVLGPRAGQIDFEIFDEETIHPESFVFSTRKERQHSNPAVYDHVSSISLGGQIFSIGWSRGTTLSPQNYYAAALTAASMALGTCLLAGLIISLQNTNHRANQMVQSRTAELEKTNSTLKVEMEERKKIAGEAKLAHQAAESASLAKTEFLAVMSHEIRTPMNSVIGFSELLSASKLTEEQKQWTNYILKSGNALLRIINDILDFSKIEAGKLKLENIPYSPAKSMEEVVGSFSALAMEKGINVTFQPVGEIPGFVMGDPIRLKQVATNLIGNAIKFTEQGSVTASLEWKGDSKNGILCTRIIDTGIGIPSNQLETLFEKFTQGDASTTRKFGGTGLGLAICQKLVELMGGSIWATSRRCHGTTMSFDIPLVVSERKKDVTIPPYELMAKAKKEKEYDTGEVLLVEDNNINVKLACTVLKRLGCKVTVANNGVQALRILKKKYFPVIFMDCLMPAMDGYEATREIRKLQASQAVSAWANQPPITIIALTANSSPEDRKKCMQAGMDDFIRKPCRVSDFRNALDTYLVEPSTSDAVTHQA